MSDRIERAIDQAFAWALHLPKSTPRSIRARPRRFAIGDPQASIEKFFRILEHRGLLDEDGTLAPDVCLISMGDHFDWGKPEHIVKATDEGLALLAWLAHHEAEQVVILAGNHDLARVGELARFDDATYVRMRDEARVAYRNGKVDEDAQKTFLSHWPEMPTAETGARDLSCFRVQQRTLVEHLLRNHRMQLAHSEGEKLLFVHAGVTCPDLEALGIDMSMNAPSIARALNAAFERALSAWPRGERLSVRRIHWPGSAKEGEGGGILYHRGARDGFNHRRYDPRTLPLQITQVIGHIRDQKCCDLLGEWSDHREGVDGPLRHLFTDGTTVRYARGLADEMQMIFADGGMHHIEDIARYELVDVSDPDHPRS